MATMLDVSIRAGVSKATVSRVLNGTGQVKESTRQQVFKAMEELGYRPNFLARSLANQTSNSIGLVVSTFDGFYFGRLLQQASRQTEAWGKQLIVTDGHDTPEREEEAVQMLADRQCDAIILYTRHMSEKAIMSLINSIAMPLVVINRDVAQARERCVFFEQQEAAFQAVEYLITQGHRDIACITVPMHTPTGQARLQGYRNALIKHGIEWDPSRVKYGDSTMTRGYELCWTRKPASARCFPVTMIWRWERLRRCIRRGCVFRRMCRCLASTMRQARNGWSRGCRRSICRSTT